MKFLERALDGQNQIWKYILLFVAVFFGGQMIGSIPLSIVILYKTMLSGNMANFNAANPMDFSTYGISANVGLLLALFAFVAMFFAFALLIKPLHRRTVAETINGGRLPVRKNRIYAGMFVWGLISLIGLAFDLATAKEGEIVLQFNAARFVPLLLIVLFVMPFQTTIEELLFRGYLTQGFAARTRSRWMALAIPSLLFAAMHLANPEVLAFGFWLSFPQYLVMGLFMGIVSILDDGIELAIGIHYINNVFAALMVTHTSSVLQTDAVFRANEINPVESLVFLAAGSVIAFFILAKKYRWDFRIMNQKVEIVPPVVPHEVITKTGNGIN